MSNRTEYSMYDEMIRNAPAGHLWVIHPCGTVKIGMTAPTKAEIIDGYMTIPVDTPSHRDAHGCWVYDRKYYTREEAEAMYEQLMARRPAHGDAAD